jgi:hypothetical protein
MELGACVCTVTSPKCDSCPISKSCYAFASVQHKSSNAIGNATEILCEGKTQKPITDFFKKQTPNLNVQTKANDKADSSSLSSFSISCEPQLTTELCPVCSVGYIPTDELAVTRYPQKVKKATKKTQIANVSIVETVVGNENFYLLIRRPKNGLLGSFWEFPTLEVDVTDPEQLTKKRKRKSEKKKSESEVNEESDNIKSFDYNDFQMQQNNLLHHFIDIDILSPHHTSPTTTSPSKVPSPHHSNKASVAILNRTYVGVTTHLFSHISQTLFVEYIRCQPLTKYFEEMNWQRDSSLLLKDEVGDGAMKDKSSDVNRVQWVRRENLLEKAISKGMRKCWEMVCQNIAKENRKSIGKVEEKEKEKIKGEKTRAVSGKGKGKEKEIEKGKVKVEKRKSKKKKIES